MSPPRHPHARLKAELWAAVLLLGCAPGWAQQALPSGPAPTNTSAANKSTEDKLNADWADLSEYREANQALPKPQAGEPRVVFMGASVTQFWGQKDSEGVSAMEQFFPGKHYINRGISGQTTPQMLVRFRQDVLDLQPDVVMLLAGTNDIAGNTGRMTLRQTEDNLSSMAELALVHHVAVILCSVTPASSFPWAPAIQPSATIVELNAWIRRYALEHHLSYVDYYALLVDDHGGFRADLSEDGVHPNRKAYALMAPLAQAAIAESLKRH